MNSNIHIKASLPIAGDRAIFANQLRALAIISVLIVHWCGIYWYARDTVATYIHAPAIEGPPSSLIGALTIPTFNYGPFGVALFFLISGFVIPFSLQRLSPAQFIISRFFRIYPTYIIASLVMIFFVYMSSGYWNIPFSLSVARVISNLALFNDNLGHPTIDLVNWTLAVEVKFYIACSILHKTIKSANTRNLILFSVLVLVFCEWQGKLFELLSIKNTNISMDSLKTELMCIVFMFIGTCFHYHYIGKKSWKELAVETSTLLLIFIMCWPHTFWAGQMPNVPQNYIYALSVFSVAYYFRRFARPFAPLDFVANISYSIYVLHSIIGYTIIRICMNVGASFPVSLFITIVSVFTMAYLLHISVEMPTMRLGKRLAALIRNDISSKTPEISKGTTKTEIS